MMVVLPAKCKQAPWDPGTLTAPQACTTLSCMIKTEVYSWRLSHDLKTELEEAARVEEKSLAALLEEIAQGWLASSRRHGSSEAREERLRAAAASFVGAIEGKDPRRAETAGATVRFRLARRHGR